MLKSLLIFVFLYLWSLFADISTCIVFILYILTFTTLLTISLSEMNIIKKYAIADILFHQDSSLFTLMKSVWFTLFISLLMAFGASVFLLVGTLYIDSTIILVLGVDVVVIWMIHHYVKKALLPRVKTPFLDVIARKWSVWINAVFLILIFVLYQFFTAPSYEIKEFNCEILNFLSSSLHYKELLEWKLMSQTTGMLKSGDTIFIWSLYLLLSQGLFSWTYSKLLLSVSIPKAIIANTDTKEQNYFLVGFIATLLLLFVTTMAINYLYEKKHMRDVIVQVNEAYQQIDKKINNSLTAKEELLIYDINSVIDKEVDMAFKPVYKSIPNLSNYYYSVKGEYSRIILKGYSLYCGYKNDYLAPYYNQYLPNGFKLKQCSSDMLDKEIQSKIDLYLFEQNDFSSRVDSASHNINIAINSSMKLFKDELMSDLKVLELEYDIKLNSLDNNFENVFEASSRDITKKGLSATGTALISGAISKSIMSKMLLKFGAKGATKASTFLAGSATGLTICAPSGPWALLCGVVTGTASWVGVDAAMTEVDQAFNEDDFVLSVEMMIDAQKNSLKGLMKASHREWTEEIFINLKKDTDTLKSPYEQVSTSP